MSNEMPKEKSEAEKSDEELWEQVENGRDISARVSAGFVLSRRKKERKDKEINKIIDSIPQRHKEHR